MVIILMKLRKHKEGRLKNTTLFDSWGKPKALDEFYIPKYQQICTKLHTYISKE